MHKDTKRRNDAAGTRTPTRWFYYDKSGQEVGPFDWNTMQILARSGIVQPETMIASWKTPRQPARNFADDENGLNFSDLDSIHPKKRKTIVSPRASKKESAVPSAESQPDIGNGCIGCLGIFLLFVLIGMIGSCLDSVR